MRKPKTFFSLNCICFTFSNEENHVYESFVSIIHAGSLHQEWGKREYGSFAIACYVL